MRRLIVNWRWLVLDFAYAGRVRTTAFFRRHNPFGESSGDKQPVVVIPGVYETWQFMKPVASRLAALGHPVHVITELRFNIAPIPDAAATVQRYLDEHDLQSVVLVAHSKGGLIAKHMMLVDDVAGRIDRLVAIATPFNGSSYARYMPNKPLRAFIPTEATLAMLAGRSDANTRITSVFPIFDGHIPEGSRLEGARNVEVPVHGHFRMLADDRSLRAVVDAVESTGS
jgi:pimeloyl-ACP methyl ester carboxylesterase